MSSRCHNRRVHELPSVAQLASRIDHAVLKPNATERDGATELDMVINIGALLDDDYATSD